MNYALRRVQEIGSGSVPWTALLSLIEPHYPKRGRPGRQPYRLSTMLRIHFLQQWYALSDPGREEALDEIPTLRRCAQLGGLDTIPDETTSLNFQRLLETQGLAERIFEAANVADVTQVHKRLHGKEDTICGDSGYTGAGVDAVRVVEPVDGAPTFVANDWVIAPDGRGNAMKTA